MPAASAHVLVEPGEDCHAVRADLEAVLAAHGITHATLQVDHVAGESRPPGLRPDQAGCEDSHDTGHLPDQEHCEDSHGPVYRSGQPTQ
jgi:cobalt-zinc-cadmium efflux system protein